ncbi:unnamed protein product [Arabis nemorensis]|uniref:Knottin scorpion toxin-like domain-containing protein n=1 Tax=Arabis nemorensis TaxID=586526 RepID=A0A565CD45_9BRAS|nr:unnamed protein product [Arabis nemorensis]
MAKTFNSICFTTLLLVVVLISAEIPKSEAQTCNRIIGESRAGIPCRNLDCQVSCQVQYRLACRGVCERLDDNELHCNCYETPRREAPTCNRILGEATPGNPCRNLDCQVSCRVRYRQACRGVCELIENERHCNCYGD